MHRTATTFVTVVGAAAADGSLGHLLFGVESFTPLGRLGHSSILIDNRLYFIGGLKDAEVSNEVFYLDVSGQFNVSAPPWVDFTTIPFKSAFATVAMRSINKESTIYLLGGYMLDINADNNVFTPFLSTLDLNTLKWNRPYINGKEPVNRIGMKSVIDNTGKIYIYGGIEGNQFFDDMIILNTNDLSWSYGPKIDSPKNRAGYTATLLSNGVIVYIGGRVESREVEISEIHLYNTNSSTWSVKTAKLTNPVNNRTFHTAVLIPDGKIIIYGGSRSVGGISFVQVTPDLAVLNTNTEPFEWTAPAVSSNAEIPSLMFHTADLVGNYMIVAFGNITRPNAEPLENKNSNIYVLDIRSYTWVNTFETSKFTTTKIVITTISAILGTAVLVGLGFLVYKWRKMKKANQPVVRYKDPITYNDPIAYNDPIVSYNDPVAYNDPNGQNVSRSPHLSLTPFDSNNDSGRMYDK